MGEHSPTGEGVKGQGIVQARATHKFWDLRFVITTVLLILIALIAAYLQYALYPSIIENPPFLESNISIHFSVLTYSYNAFRCVGVQVPVDQCPSSVQHIIGVPAFDFFQLFVIILILANAYHLWRWSKGP